MNSVIEDFRMPVTVGGVTFKNPFYVASGPTTKTVRQLQRIEETGWAAASIKLSIDPAPYINRKPRYSLFKDRDALAFTAEKRLTFEEGLKLIKEAKPKLHDLILMANITYAGDGGVEGWVNMAKRFEEVGADIIELNMCCPNMSYNLEMTSGGSKQAAKKTGASMGQHADIASEIVAAIKKEIHIPLFVKLTPEGGQIAQVAKALYAAGADAVGGTGNRLGMPPIDLDDPGKAFFHLQDEISMGCYCSGWLKPLAQRDTYEIRKVCGMESPITATGGIRNWRDAVEMVLCGGTLLGVCAETLISGYDIVRPMINGLHQYMQEHGYTDLSQMRGLIVPQVKTASDVTIYAGHARIKDPNLSAPCKSACPHHVPIQAYVQKITKGEFRAAYDLITEKNPMQSLCALVCAHPCEDACVRGSIDAPIKIRALKRFVMEYGKKQGWKPAWARAEENGHRVAVVGAGASGLACALELRKAGYSVTVFEKEEKVGGALRYGMPDYAYQKQVLEQEIQDLKALGICFETGKMIDDAAIEALKAEGFDRVFNATGKHCRVESGLPGAKYADDVLDFLHAVNCGEKPAVKKNVAVIGNGFAAIDAARCAVRLGAKKVTLLSPVAFSKRSAETEALRLAREEGVCLIERAPVESLEENDVHFVLDGTAMELHCEQMLLLNEFTAWQPKNEGDFVITLRSRGDNLISAITTGKNGAAEVDKAIRGEEASLKPVEPVKTVNPEAVRKRVGYLKGDKNPICTESAAEERIRSFDPYTRAMTQEEAMKEASRCLNCGCGEGCQLCKTICTDFAPKIIEADTLQICKEDCVACGMCYNRCPNNNIEMVNLGEKV